MIVQNRKQVLGGSEFTQTTPSFSKCSGVESHARPRPVKAMACNVNQPPNLLQRRSDITSKGD